MQDGGFPEPPLFLAEGEPDDLLLGKAPVLDLREYVGGNLRDTVHKMLAHRVILAVAVLSSFIIADDNVVAHDVDDIDLPSRKIGFSIHRVPDPCWSFDHEHSIHII
ncbi:MAG: hypothetical protein ACOC4M_09100 [Promethearchaeia archaeon]